jgi:hypothetical protein
MLFAAVGSHDYPFTAHDNGIARRVFEVAPWHALEASSHDACRHKRRSSTLNLTPDLGRGEWLFSLCVIAIDPPVCVRTAA